jgi:hypothetical protein
MNSSTATRVALAKRWIGCGLVLFHMVAVSIANLAEGTKLSAQLHRAVDPYVRFFGQWQEWDMFTTVPLYLSIEGRVVAKLPDGSEHEYPPVLPGLVPAPYNLRYVSMFARVVWAKRSFRWHSERYLSALCRAIGTREGVKPKSIRLEIDTQTIRPLKQIRQDGEIAEARTFKAEEVACSP